MPGLQPENSINPQRDVNKVDLLDKKIKRYTDEIEKLRKISGGEELTLYKALEAIRDYWISVKEGCLTSAIQRLSDPNDRSTVEQIASLLEIQSDDIADAMPEDGEAG
jgi:hypothetical protein